MSIVNWSGFGLTVSQSQLYRIFNGLAPRIINRLCYVPKANVKQDDLYPEEVEGDRILDVFTPFLVKEVY